MEEVKQNLFNNFIETEKTLQEETDNIAYDRFGQDNIISVLRKLEGLIDSLIRYQNALELEARK